MVGNQNHLANLQDNGVVDECVSRTGTKLKVPDAAQEMREGPSTYTWLSKFGNRYTTK